MNGYLQAFAGAADQLRDVTFLRLLLPVLLVVGVALTIRWGVRGVTLRRTVLFGRAASGRLLHGEVEGGAAVFVGVLHFVCAGGMLATLGPLSFYLWWPR
ncbi:hypothetical protein OV203_19090 [Nannocystis sp. ILAH1]|uniref:hypothetical protein n=1 Tax=unclassified Nannocystis TaxID=2627009 RepID=UPI00227110E3|nr:MULTISPECIES: hypothetical protein [unclassified Nannocystis]MCY0989252.1 hypothetical protein [Nannocystis sp. ILAH1]MCY1065054.1 hypothetical protein [Nannocystis sp. RBIL2]